MAGEWRAATLGEVVRLQRGHDLPDKDRHEGSVPVMGSFGITGWHNEARAKGPGVTVGRSGASIGVVSYIEEDYWPLNTCLFVTDFLGNDPKFCYYWLKKQNLAAYNSGSAQPSLNRNYIYGMPARIPASVDEQRAIAHILGTLDDKIELNRRMNETLEAIARAIFKSWFVDFDPVRAKASGEAPESICRRLHLTPDLLALVPDRFQDSELGEIPEGWRVRPLGDIAEHQRRGVQPNQIAATMPYIALEHMPRHCIALSEWDVADGIESNKFEFKKGEILFGKLRPYFHKVGIAPVDGVCSTDIVVITPKSDEWFGFVLGHVSSDAFVEHTNAGSTGTKMPRTNWSDMSRYMIVAPPSATAEAHTNLIRSLVEHINASIHEARTLAAMRDTLHPKLLSGELRVPDAERLADSVVS